MLNERSSNLKISILVFHHIENSNRSLGFSGLVNDTTKPVGSSSINATNTDESLIRSFHLVSGSPASLSKVHPKASGESTNAFRRINCIVANHLYLARVFELHSSKKSNRLKSICRVIFLEITLLRSP